MVKAQEKEKAIKLREKGFSYSEVLKEIPVAKSTLSLWLRSVGLSKKQKQKLTDKKLAAMKRGWLKVKQERIEKTRLIKEGAKEKVPKFIKNPLWLAGIMLYWAEGSKEKEHNVSQGVQFSNSDPVMVKLFLKWLKNILKIQDDKLKFEIYIHENWKSKIDGIKDYWAKIVKVSPIRFKVYYKKHNIKTKRKNISEKYFGLIRINVAQSSNLNRKINGWIEGICEILL